MGEMPPPPLTACLHEDRAPGWWIASLLDYYCLENEKDSIHMVGK